MLDSCQCLKLSDFSLARQVEVEESTHHQNKEDIVQATRAVFQQYCTTSRGRTEHCSVAPELASTSAVVSAPSPFYVAPEIFSGQFTLASNLWSLGCLLFEMCTGRCDTWENVMWYRWESAMMCMYLGDMLVGNCRMFRVALQLCQFLL